MATLQEIYDVETACESGVAAILTDKGLTAVSALDATNVVTPYVAVRFITGPAGPHRYIASSGNVYYDTWEGTLLLTVMSQRDAGGHRDMVSTVRLAMQVGQANFTSDRFPTHSIRNVLETGTAPDVVAKDDIDVTAITFACIVNVNQDAWPVDA